MANKLLNVLILLVCIVGIWFNIFVNLTYATSVISLALVFIAIICLCIGAVGATLSIIHE